MPSNPSQDPDHELLEEYHFDYQKAKPNRFSDPAAEEKPSLQPGATYSVWSPLNSHAAAHQLAQLLESEQP
jgi:hypothetical protein